MPEDGDVQGTAGPTDAARGSRLVRLAAAGGLGAAVLITLASAPASGDVASDQAQITQLEQKIAQDGAQVEDLVAEYNHAQAQLDALNSEVATGQAQLAADRQVEARAIANLRSIALQGYMSAGEGEPSLALFSPGNDVMSAQAEYTSLAEGHLNTAVDAVRLDEHRTQMTQSQLSQAQAQAAAAVTQLADDRQAAQGAMNRDSALLASVKGNLQTLLAAAAAQAAAAERAKEEAMVPKTPLTSAQPAPPVTFHPSPGSYANPLRGIAALNPERIDQGVDYSGYGPIYAIGDGVVMSTSNGGWPGGTFIAYRLSDGPASGLVVYAAEDINPTVSVGQTVTAATQIGTVYEGPSGIETGWSNPDANGTTMANDYGQFNGSNSTAFGANFSQLLASLGAPPGILQNDPPTGTLPPGWPTW